MLDIASGLKFMHWKQVANCDMKPAIVLVDQDKFGNFLPKFNVANVAFVAPEVMIRLRYRIESNQELLYAGDVYSF